MFCFFFAPDFSLVWWVGFVRKCTSALKDNKDFLVGRSCLDPSARHSAIFYPYLPKIGYFYLWVYVFIAGFAESSAASHVLKKQEGPLLCIKALSVRPTTSQFQREAKKT